MLSCMEPEAAVGAEVDADRRVMAAIEEQAVEQLVLADITRDGAYLKLPLSEAASLPAWR